MWVVIVYMFIICLKVGSLGVVLFFCIQDAHKLC